MCVTCTCVCMYAICTFVCVCDMHVCVHVYACDMHVFVCAHVYVCDMHVFVCVHVYVCVICTFVCVRVCVICTCVHVYVCDMHVCVYVYVCDMHMCLCACVCVGEHVSQTRRREGGKTVYSFTPTALWTPFHQGTGHLLSQKACCHPHLSFESGLGAQMFMEMRKRERNFVHENVPSASPSSFWNKPCCQVPILEWNPVPTVAGFGSRIFTNGCLGIFPRLGPLRAPHWPSEADSHPPKSRARLQPAASVVLSALQGWGCDKDKVDRGH